MRNIRSALESALNKKPNAQPPEGPQGGAPYQPFPAQPQRRPQAAQMQAAPAGMLDFDEVLAEFEDLLASGKLPEGLDLQEICTDDAFAKLIVEYPADAAVRIYVAERRAEEAENSAMQRVNQQVRTRNSLPRSARGGAMSAPAPNYRDMDDESFRKLLGDLKKTARNGGKTRL